MLIILLQHEHQGFLITGHRSSGGSAILAVSGPSSGQSVHMISPHGAYKTFICMHVYIRKINRTDQAGSDRWVKDLRIWTAWIMDHEVKTFDLVPNLLHRVFSFRHI